MGVPPLRSFVPFGLVARWERGLRNFPWCRRVFLHATDESALQNGITMDALREYAAEPEAAGGGGSLEKKAPIEPGTTGGIARETH